MNGVSAKEKYEQLKAAGENLPRCKCHDETMGWNIKPERPGGGFWYCRIKHASAWKNWRDGLSDERLRELRAETSERAQRWRSDNEEHCAEYRARPDVRLRQQLREMTRVRIYY